MILPKNCNLRHSVPLRFTPKDFQKKGFLTNKQTIFFQFFTPKSFVPSYLFMDRDMRKNHHQKQCKKSNSCSSMRFLYFRVEILYRWLGWSNFKILSFGKAHMVRKDPNFWYLMKKSSCQKSVQKKCKSAGALSLKLSKDCVFIAIFKKLFLNLSILTIFWWNVNDYGNLE